MYNSMYSMHLVAMVMHTLYVIVKASFTSSLPWQPLLELLFWVQTVVAMATYFNCVITILSLGFAKVLLL